MGISEPPRTWAVRKGEMEDLSDKPLSWTGTHPLERLYLDVKARAERAEAEQYQLHRAWSDKVDECEDLRAELDAARAGLAALEAAQAWQSVNESPPESGDYIGVNMDDKNPVVRCVHYDRDYDSDDEWPWSLAYDGTFEPISHWLPLPAAPGDGGEEE